MERLGLLAAAGLSVTLANFTASHALTSEPRQRRHRYKAGPHPVPESEPIREDYPTRQAWRADHRRWLSATRKTTHD